MTDIKGIDRKSNTF